MGKYIAQADIENVFGEDNVVLWSNLEGGDTVNTTRVETAIEYGEAVVEDTFRDGRYALPFSPIPKVVINWCAILAGVWLFRCRPSFSKDSESGEGYTILEDNVFEEFGKYLSSQRKLNTGLKEAKAVNAPAVV